MKTTETNVLIVDDDQDCIRVLLGVLARRGIRGLVAAGRKEAGEFLDRHPVDLVVAGVSMERPQEGFRLLREIHSNTPDLPVILAGSCSAADRPHSQQLVDTAMDAAAAGCGRLLLKPLNAAVLEGLLETLLPNQHVSSADADASLQRRGYCIIGKSPKLMQTLHLAEKVAATSVPVLISGESGTGKELIAALIHSKSRRSAGPYIQVNCAALNDTLLESEMFGHEKGAFTGAYAQRKGRFEMAHGGTLLLDEITETPIKFQATLLRVLEQQDFERVGGNDSVRVDVRILSTTNRDLAEEVARGRFRQDLYYRLCGIRVMVPSLAERTDDLEDLVWHFVNLYSRQTGRKITSLCGDMMHLFSQYPWPGNIRQLRNVIRTSLILGAGSTLSLADASWLFDEIQPRPQQDLGLPELRPEASGLSLAAVERCTILDTLKQTSGNQTRAAKILGISDRTLRGKIRQYRQQECLQTI